MTAERWAQITGVFRAALEKPAGERAAFLEEACGGDEALRRNIEQLLAGEAEPSLPSPVPEILQQGALELSPGEMLAHYRVEGKIGEGGMGAVYRAHDTRLHRPVALKLLPPEASADADRKGRLLREARAASVLNHPNIVTIYEVGSDRGADFIAMEFVPGKTLAGLIGRKRLPLGAALKYGVQIAGALAVAHRAGIVHRDLKPANIMVNDAGQVKVLDFGLAKRADRGAEGTPGEEAGSTHTLGPDTDTGAVLGTAAYMSPEQAEGKKVDARSDIFSFGAALYEMVTGRRAFQRDSTAATLAAILKEDPRPSAEIVPGLPADLEKILARCLRKDPERRFQHASDLKVELEELREQPATGLPRAGVPPVGGRWIWAAAAVAALAIGTAGLLVMEHLARAPDAGPNIVPLTMYPGDEAAASFSPDGNQVAFVWGRTEGRNIDIYMKSVDGTQPLRLTTDPAPDTSPAWSPDGRQIAFCRGSAVYVMAALGGSEREIAALTAAAGSLSWAPDGKRLAFADRERPTEPIRIFVLSMETFDRRVLPIPSPRHIDQRSPSFSPDGRSECAGEQRSLRG